MDAVYLLLPLAVILGSIELGFLIWSIRDDQFDDLEGPAHRILFEDDQELVPTGKQGDEERTEIPGDKDH
ncbi:MAG: cbb3-type cytochrome oxidase assembly protein CcoS [Magnetococcus sp. YQC-5]